MKRRTNPSLPRRRSVLAELYLGLPPLSRIDSFSDADAWFLLTRHLPLILGALDSDSDRALFWLGVDDFFARRSLSENSSGGYCELLKDGNSIAGGTFPGLLDTKERETFTGHL